MPPRRLLAVAAAFALFGGPVEAQSAPQTSGPTITARAAAGCPLGAFHCAPRPVSFAMCRPNAMLDFYDPLLSKDSSVRATSNTYVYAERVDSSNQSIYHLEGRVKMERADQRVQADVADYNQDTSDYDARGNVRYQEVGQLMSSDHMRGNQDASTGIADNVTYQMLTSRGHGVAEQGQMLDDQRTRYFQATYSTCDVGSHVWELRAKDIRMDKETGEGIARSATMYVGNVPIFYMPYFSFPINDERKTGFLDPTIGNSSRSGLMISAPYYLNLAPNYDATLDPRIYTDRGVLLGGEFRYYVPGSTGQMNIEFLPNDRGTTDPDSVINTENTNRYLFKLNDYTHLFGPWAFTTSINRASDRNYLRDFGNDLFTASIGTLTSSAYVVGSGTWGGGSLWAAWIGADDYQNIDPSLPDSSVQYKRWPRAVFNVDVPIERWLEFGANTEAVAFRKDESVEGNRLDLYPYLAADFRGASWFVRPKVAYRYTAYDLIGNYNAFGYVGPLTPGIATPFTQTSPSRSLPIVSLDSGLIFDRSTSLFGTSYTQTLEPRIYYLYVPYRDQDNLPLFDTNLMSFDTWQLFTPNQFSGADRQMNANNLTGAITSRLLDENGVERLSASFGQIRYFTEQRVQLPYGNSVPPPTNWSGSDYVAELDTQLDDQWRVTSSYQWNPNTRLTDLGAIGVQRRLLTDGIINFSYRYRRTPGSVQPLLEQYDASIVYPVSDRWRLLGHWTYSVLDKATVEALAGVEYDSCCVALRLIARHYVNSYNYLTPAAGASTNTSIMFEVEFKGMGSSMGKSENLLRSGILGYQ
nr:LPS assembly protein LptD [Dyella humicola]